VVYETAEAKHTASVGDWDSFAMRNIGYALQRRMVREFGGDAAAMRRASVAHLARELGARPAKIFAKEESAFADFAMVMRLVPGWERWSRDEKEHLRAIIAAKSARTELRYQSLLLSHGRLRKAILKLGSRSQ